MHAYFSISELYKRYKHSLSVFKIIEKTLIFCYKLGQVFETINTIALISTFGIVKGEVEKSGSVTRAIMFLIHKES